MKPNPFLVSPAPKDKTGGPRPELLQQAFAKELLEFGPAVFLCDTRGEIRWSNAAYRKIAETKAGNTQVGNVLPLKDIAEEIDLKRQPLFREDPIGPGAVLRSRHVPLFDERGRSYLDFFSGLAVSSLGHGHVGLARAVAEQAAKIVHTSNLYYSEPAAKLAARLVEKTFSAPMRPVLPP